MQSTGGTMGQRQSRTLTQQRVPTEQRNDRTAAPNTTDKERRYLQQINGQHRNLIV